MSGAVCKIIDIFWRLEDAGVTADLDPPSQIWTPYQTFLLSIVCIIFGILVFCRCSLQSQHNISSIKVKQQTKKQPFRSNSTAFIIASLTVYARIRCEQTTAFELLKLLQ